MKLANNEPCPECGRYNNRGTSVDAIITRDDKLLLIKRGADPFKGKWALPGGFIEWDESAEEAVVREVKEETGLLVNSSKLIGVYSSPGRHPKQVITIAYAVTTSGNPAAGDDALEYDWFASTELPVELAFDHRKIIEDFFSKKQK